MAQEDRDAFIRSQVEEGKTKEEIGHALISHGYGREDFDEAYARATEESSVQSVPETPAPERGSSEQDAQRPAVASEPAAGASGGAATLPGPGTLLSSAFREFFHHKQYVLIALIPFVFFTLVGVLMYVFVPSVPAGGEESEIVQEVIAAGPAVSVAIGLAFLAGIIVQIFSMIALVSAAVGRTTGVKASYQYGLARFFSYLWVSILITLAIVGGFLLFIVPGILFAVWFSVAIYVLLAEDTRGIAALQRSRAYVRGRWWGVFGRLFVISLVMFAANLVLMLFGFIPVIGDMLTGAVSTLILTPIGVLYGVHLYRGLRAEKGTVETASGRGWVIGAVVLGIVAMLLVPIGLTALLMNVGKTPSDPDVQTSMQVLTLHVPLELYYDEHGVYPDTLEQLEGGPLSPGEMPNVTYRPLEEGQDYEICYGPENAEQTCITSDTYSGE